MATEAMQLSLGQAFRMIHGDHSGGGSSRARAHARSRYQKSKSKSKSEISRAKAPQKDLESAEAFFDRIFQELGDPALQAAPVRKVAARLAEGLLPWDTVQAAIDKARQLFCEGKVDAPWIYFTGAMRRCFEERRWQWRRKT